VVHVLENGARDAPARDHAQVCDAVDDLQDGPGVDAAGAARLRAKGHGRLAEAPTR
jgi:hypothetical protein